MGIIDLIRGRRSQDNQAVTGMFRMGRASYNATSWGFTRIANSVYANPTGFRCFSMIESAFSRPDWVVYEPGTTEKIDAHPLLDILNKPNGILAPAGGAMSGTLMQRLMIQNMRLTGRSFWFKLRGNDGLQPIGNTTGLRYLAPQRVTVLGNDDDELVGFMYQDRQGARQPMLPGDVLFTRYPHPDRLYDGFAPALVAGLPAETDNLSQRFNYDILANDGAVPAVIVVQGLQPEQFKAFKEKWEAREFPGKTRFIGGSGAQYIKVGQSNQELTYSALRDDSKQDICHALGVPQVLVEPTDATFANYEGANSSFYQTGIAPDWVLVADELTAQLGVEFGVDVGFDLSVVDELQEAADAIVDRELKLISVQASTPNQLLRMLGRDPVDWGDKPVLPVAPLKPAPQQPPGTEPGDADASAAALLSIDSAQEYRDQLMRLLPQSAALPEPPQIQKAAAPKTKDVGISDKQIATQEGRAQRAMAKFFSRQGKVVAARLAHSKGKAAAKAVHHAAAGDDGDLLDRDRWDSELADDSSDILDDSIDAFGTAAAGDIGGKPFDADASRVKNYITSRSTKIAKLVNDTTEAELRKLLADQESQGNSIDQMVAAVKSYFDDSDGRAANRAETFARTETIGASTFGLLEAARQSGVATGKTWLAAGTGADAECSDLDGTSVGIDDTFDTSDGSVDGPPAHPNCRCTLTIQTTAGEEEDDSNDDDS